MALLKVVLPQSPYFSGSTYSINKGSHVLGGVVKLTPPRKVFGSNLITCLKGNTASSPIVEGVKPATIKRHHEIKRRDFPHDFKFGVSTSALQTEGSGSEGGRGASTWDSFIQDPKVPGTENATDSYNKYKEDVQLLKNMGVDLYRFSISWSRILPTGKLSGGLNQEGINFYNNFINELIQNGIEPLVTLFHFDLPQALQDEYGGFLNHKIVDDFKAYSEICFENFGDRVKHWSTINEPQLFGNFGYRVGQKQKGNVATDPYVANHNIILSHAAAATLYKEKYQAKQGGEIGISIVGQWFTPHSELPHDKDAAERANDFMVGLYMDPLVYGDYPFIIKALVRDALPKFTEEEQKMVKGSFDFIGVNYYTSRYAAGRTIPPIEVPHTSFEGYQYVDQKVEKDGKLIGELADGSDQIYVYPDGLKEVLLHLKRDYGNPKILVTENGYPEKRDDTIPLKEALEDDPRIEFIKLHLNSVQEAMKEGVNVKGYVIWALMDCMEMGSAYDVRFGLNYVDYNDGLKRYPKKSAKWLHDFLKKH